jgi:exodeoxyribonuclease V gamma subunit
MHAWGLCSGLRCIVPFLSLFKALLSMFNLYQSNKVETLFTQLVRLLLQQDASPLETQTVVVENPGLAHWLKMQLANSLGIAANIEFPMPSRFFWQTQRIVSPDLAQESVYQKDNLRWLIFECLQNEALLERPEFVLLQHYMSQGPSNSEAHALRQYRLAITISDLYDQYLVYRPDWIHNWEHENFELDNKPLGDQAWQGILWFELRKLIQAKNLPLAHRANMLDDFLTHLQKGHKNLPKQVIFFGFTTLPKHQLDSLSVLSQNMDVHLLTPNPCEHYWGDVLDETTQAKLRLKGKDVLLAHAGNDLLASLGRMGQDYQRLLLDVPNIQEQSLFYDDSENQEVAPSLLSSIQQQILHLQGGLQAPIEATDTSLQVVGCHSPMREVEVLHDHLLSLLDQGKPLKPQDIVVMIPDVAAYAPFIDAVFNSKSRTQFIPYSISDRPLQAEHPLLNAFLLLLKVPNSRMGLSEVLALLEMPAIYKKYGLKESQLKPLSQWLVEAGVRWGFDEEHRAQQDLPPWQANSWLYGFKRLLMGYAMNSSEEILGIVPVANVEGLDAILLGPLKKFVDDLHELSKSACQARDAQQWSLFINDLLHNFFEVEGEEQNILEHVHLCLENWTANVQLAHYEQDITFDVLADGLNQGLQKSAGSQHFMVGKVNFCTLLPMRSIPFKVVAVLGLNDQDYPRSVTPSSLDLMHTRRRLGDRSRRDEDRYLFLEAILSARESLWLSYRSKSQQNDEPLTPSVVLAELLDYIKANFTNLNDGSDKNGGQNLLTQHPLQAFNPLYFQAESSLFSYNKDWLAVHTPLKSACKQEAVKKLQILDDTASNEILMEDFIQFFMHPAKYYLNKVLKVNLFFESDVQDDDEPFELDYLQQYQVKQNVIQQFLTDKKTKDASHSVSEGLNAFGEIGERQWNKLKSTIEPVLQCCEEYMQDKVLNPVEINLSFDDLSLSLMGWQKDLYGANLVKVVPSKLKAKSIIPAILEHAALCAMGKGHTCVVICQDQKFNLQIMEQNQAKQYLHALLDVYQQGQRAPLAMLPQSAWQLYNPAHLKEKKGEVVDKRLAEAQKTFYGATGPFGQPGEREDLNIRRCFNELDDIPEQTHALAKSFYAPWLESQLLSLSSLTQDAS